MRWPRNFLAEEKRLLDCSPSSSNSPSTSVDIAIVIALLGLLLVGGLLSDVFLTPRNLTSIAVASSILIVVAIGEKQTLQRGFGTSTQASIQPCAYNNPIYIDVDGGGFEPNYDTLGFELPVSKLSVDKVEALLGL